MPPPQPMRESAAVFYSANHIYHLLIAPTTVQLSALESEGVRNIYDLLVKSAQHSAYDGKPACICSAYLGSVSIAVHRKYVRRFLFDRCENVSIDVQKAIQSRAMVEAGLISNPWWGASPPLPTVPPPQTKDIQIDTWEKPVTFFSEFVCSGIDDDEATIESAIASLSAEEPLCVGEDEHIVVGSAENNNALETAVGSPVKTSPLRKGASSNWSPFRSPTSIMK